MKKYIFDLDGTIMNKNFEYENILFRKKLNKEDRERFMPIKDKILSEYEKYNSTYDVKLMSKYLTEKSGVYISEKLVEEWLLEGSNADDKLVEGIIPLLDYLKSENKKMVVLTNWFTKTQQQRLINKNISDYFEKVYGGEIYIKPSRGAFIQAAGPTPFDECVMIGNDYSKDVLAARRIGMNGVYYAAKEDNIEDEYKVKKLIDIKEMF